MKFGEVEQANGNIWKYYRCPTSNWDTKCYVTCPVDEVGDYLRRVERQTHPCYKDIDPARFRCDCDLSLVLATSHSVNNPDRLYLKCPTHSCKFFQWINQPPRGLAKNILIDKDRIAELYKWTLFTHKFFARGVAGLYDDDFLIYNYNFLIDNSCIWELILSLYLVHHLRLIVQVYILIIELNSVSIS